MQRALVDLEITRVDLVDEGANSEAFIKIYKKKEGGKEMTFEEILKSLDEEQAKVIEDAMAEARKENEPEIAKAKEDLEAATAEIAKLKEEAVVADATTVTEEEILKSVAPEVRNIIEKARLQAKIAEEAIKKMHQEDTEREAVVKAKEVVAVGVPEAELVELYKNLKHKDEKLATSVFEALQTASNIIKEGEVFKVKGSDGESDNDAEAAWGKIEQKATEIAKARSISKEAAVEAVMTENPEMYKEYIQGQTK